MELSSNINNIKKKIYNVQLLEMELSSNINNIKKENKNTVIGNGTKFQGQ